MDNEQMQNPIKCFFSVAQYFKTLPLVVVYDTLIAVFLILTGIDGSFAISLIMAQAYGISIYTLIVVLLRVFNPKGKLLRSIVICIIGSGCGYLAGSLIGPLIVELCLSVKIVFPTFAIRNVVFALTFGVVASYIFYSLAHFRTSAELIQKERFNRLASEKEALEARLRLLQAQIEPHFLFNTLSNVLSLIDTNPAQSKSMLSDLIQYLRTSLSRTLPAVTTLGQEADMIRAYLDIQKVRMGDRLSFTIELPDALNQFPFPPMLLQPIVENAVEHGLSPRVEGGTIKVKASERNSAVRIEICDTGNGFPTIEKSGVGIANVKERIRLLYGDKGSLVIEENMPHGVRAMIEVPGNAL
jgi:sensor histidine kinase YesM